MVAFSQSQSTWRIHLRNLLLFQIFILENAKRILRMHLPNRLLKETLKWCPSRYGNFTVKSVYKFLDSQTVKHPLNDMGRKMWISNGN